MTVWIGVLLTQLSPSTEKFKRFVDVSMRIIFEQNSYFAQEDPWEIPLRLQLSVGDENLIQKRAEIREVLEALQFPQPRSDLHQDVFACLESLSKICMG